MLVFRLSAFPKSIVKCRGEARGFFGVEFMVSVHMAA